MPSPPNSRQLQASPKIHKLQTVTSCAFILKARRPIFNFLLAPGPATQEAPAADEAAAAEEAGCLVWAENESNGRANSK